MKLEIKTKAEAREILRGLRLANKYALPFVADTSLVEEKLEAFIN